jgi:hypothetical protein
MKNHKRFINYAVRFTRTGGRSYLITLSFIILSFSCTEVVFDSPQPDGIKAMKDIPESLQGSYSFVVLNEQQAINITSEYFEGTEGKKYLSDSLVLKKFGNKYVVNQRIDKEGETKGKWSAFIFEEKGCGFIKATAFVISEDKHVVPFTETYNAVLAGSGEEKQLIINPSKKEFEALTKDRDATLTMILEKLE